MIGARNSTLKIRTYKQGPKYIIPRPPDNSYMYKKNLLKYFFIIILILAVLAGSGYGIYVLVKYLQKEYFVSERELEYKVNTTNSVSF